MAEQNRLDKILNDLLEQYVYYDEVCKLSDDVIIISSDKLQYLTAIADTYDGVTLIHHYCYYSADGFPVNKGIFQIIN